jgi:hypothetical protein
MMSNTLYLFRSLSEVSNMTSKVGTGKAEVRYEDVQLQGISARRDEAATSG